MVPVSRKERDRQLRRNDILDAAEKVFAARGFHNTTVSEIAAAAQYGTGTVYLYFKDKEEIYRAIIEKGIDDFLRNAREKTAAILDPIDKLRCFIKEKNNFFEAHCDFFKIYLLENNNCSSNFTGGVGARLTEKQKQIVGFVAGIISDGIKKKLIIKADPMELAFMLGGMSNYLTLKWVIEGCKGPLSGGGDMVIDIFLKGCLTDTAR